MDYMSRSEKPTRIVTRTMILILLLTGAALSGCSDPSSARRTYVLSTGTTGGTFYPVGVALSTLVTAQQDQQFGLTAISSAGSMENVKLMRDNQAQFSLVLGVFAAWAWNGEGPVRNPQTHLRSISAMWPNVEHFMLLSRLVKNGTMMDLNELDGERFVIGARNSGAEQTGFYLFDLLGIDPQRMTLAYMGYGAAASAIQDGNIVGMNVPAGAPVSAITRAYAQMGNDITLLEFSENELNAINSGGRLFDHYTLEPGTYPYQEQAITTASSSNVLIVRDDVDEEVVYQLTRMLWENLATLQDIHSATRSMSLDEALRGVAVPLHPGALRYYREQNVEIPLQLLPPGDSAP
jgi:TRAP transporter TAXI family solute receptor